jgi:hypothetical protein
MHDTCTYHIRIRGPLDAHTFNATSPLQATVVHTGPAATQFTVCADQSALIGLLRHLHGQGFVVLSVSRES